MNDKAIEAAARAMHAAKEPYEADAAYLSDQLWDFDGKLTATIDGEVDFGELAKAAIRAYNAAMEAEGAVRVPVVPTEAMLEAGSAAFPNYHDHHMEFEPAYRAMIAARPRAEGE